MTNQDKEKIIADFTEAYTKVNGSAPSIEVKSGWYSVDGGKNVRLAQLQDMTASLSGQLTPAATKQPAATKTVSEKKPKKSASTSKKPQKVSGFSVKAFWAEKLKNEAPGATLPR